MLKILTRKQKLLYKSSFKLIIDDRNETSLRRFRLVWKKSEMI